MPGQKRKYNVRFPPGRIKKIMQKDTEVGRIAMAVPVIISRALEMFLKSLLNKTNQITQSKHSRIMTIAHMKQCIDTEKLFDFLKDLAEEFTVPPSQRDGRAKGKWPAQKWRASNPSIAGGKGRQRKVALWLAPTGTSAVKQSANLWVCNKN
ncbi:dr1-associated corepressor [Brienomyrus brachyistius]|uniref:dr1-associated corepressor n=1 Tax=Brienomyrus brachyistius TaxID=42636 RepID=UPI0020B2DAF2|nr:dr1-associated corepressor [Brienomyrus brachyistius]XP_048830732.1 dr1-associated corepressor [Brienomyrus brachyistius]